MRFLSIRIEGAAMKNLLIHARVSYAGIKSVLVSICVALAMAACQRAPNQPMPPQSPPKPQAHSNVPNAGNPHPGLYDATSVSSTLFKYRESTALEYQNAQGKPVKRIVIRT